MTIEEMYLTRSCLFCKTPIDPLNMAACGCGRYTPQPWLLVYRRELPPGMWEIYQGLLKADQAYAAAHFQQAGPVAPDDEGAAYGGGSFGGGVGGSL
jgi:hypothetical protein